MKLTIEAALSAVQEFGLSPDNVLIIIHDNSHEISKSIKGAWYDDRILPYLQLDTKAINISIDQDETKILAIF